MSKMDFALEDPGGLLRSEYSWRHPLRLDLPMSSSILEEPMLSKKATAKVVI